MLISTISRPKRIAFLLNPSIATHQQIDAVVRFNSDIWGGRFNGIFPTDGKIIAPDWWSALIHADPDYIYSFGALDLDLKKKIDRCILPINIIEVIGRDLEESKTSSFLTHTHELSALSARHLPQYFWNKRNSFRTPFFFVPVTGGVTNENVSFALRNFGVLSKDVQVEDTFRDIEQLEIFEIKDVTPKDCLKKVNELNRRSVVTPKDITGLYSFLPLFGHNMAHNGFHLIIGDSFHDLMYAWNRSSHTDHFMSKSTFWLPASAQSDPEMIDLVTQYINNFFWGNNEHRRGSIVSYSLSTDALKALCDQLSPKVHFYFSPVAYTPDQYPENDISWRPYGSPFNREPMQQQQVVFNDGKTLAKFAKPEFLDMGHPQTGWMVDCELEQTRTGVTFSSGEFLKLPKRIGITRYVFPKNEGRVISNGTPSVAVVCVESDVKISEPILRNFVWAFFDKSIENHRYNLALKNKYHFSISEKGRNLKGLIGLFGGLLDCKHYLEDHFWRPALLFAAGHKDAGKEERKGRYEDLLSSFFGQHEGPVEHKAESETKLIDYLAKHPIADNLKKSWLKKSDFIEFFNKYRGASLREGVETNYWNVRTKFNDLAEDYFEDLVASQILLRGFAARCRNCGSEYWYSIAETDHEIVCRGCLEKFILEVEASWSYRLNDLVKNGLLFGGTLAVLHTLIRLDTFFTFRLWYLPCQDINEEQSGEDKQFAELDLIALSETRFIIGEVKSHPEMFTEKSINKLIELGKYLEPNIIVLAAPSENAKWPEKTTQLIQKLHSELEPYDIAIQQIPLNWSSAQPIPNIFLPNHLQQKKPRPGVKKQGPVKA